MIVLPFPIPAGPCFDGVPRAEVSPNAADVLGTETMAASEVLDRLHAAGLGEDAVRILGEGLPPETAVSWGAESVGRIEPMLPPAEAKALDAGRRWAEAPSPLKAELAADAATEAGMAGPGSFVATAAAAAGGAAAFGASPAALVPKMVTGAVLLSANAEATGAVVRPDTPSARGASEAPNASPLPSAKPPSVANVADAAPDESTEPGEFPNEALEPYVALARALAGI